MRSCSPILVGSIVLFAAFLIAISPSQVLGQAKVIVVPRDDSIDRLLQEWAKQRHDEELRKQQEQHDRELQEEQHKHELELQQRQFQHENEQNQHIRADGAIQTKCPELPAPSTLSYDTTQRLLNGRAWRTWPPEIKIVYLSALYEGVVVTALATRKSAWNPYKTPALPDEIVAGLDEFYIEPDHRVIPVASAVRIFTAKTRGATDLELRAMTSNTLKNLASPSKVIQ